MGTATTSLNLSRDFDCQGAALSRADVLVFEFIRIQVLVSAFAEVAAHEFIQFSRTYRRHCEELEKYCGVFYRTRYAP